MSAIDELGKRLADDVMRATIDLLLSRGETADTVDCDACVAAIKQAWRSRADECWAEWKEWLNSNLSREWVELAIKVQVVSLAKEAIRLYDAT